MPINDDMWALYGRDLEGCRNALTSQAEELEDEQDPIALRAIARRLDSIARRLRNVSRELER